jgi:hypothetical protein
MKNYYEILGVDMKAPGEEIKRAYFELAKKYHPDSGDESEVKKFYEITEAYKALCDKEVRRHHDLEIEGEEVKKKAGEREVYTTPPSKSRPHESRYDTGREKEIRAHHARVFWSAVFKAAGFSVIMAAIGAGLSAFLKGAWFLGALAGFGIGLVWSTQSRFDVDSFIIKPRVRKFVRTARWLILLFGLAYFAALIYLFVNK